MESFAVALQDAKADALPVMALRRHRDGTMDDLVVNNVEMVRAEQMSDSDLWMACYFHNGERVAFSIRARPKRLLVYDVIEMPAEWIDWDDRKAGIKPGSDANRSEAAINRAHSCD